MKIVTAASGRRDSYQVAIALYQAQLLQSHVTDFYLPDKFLPVVQASYCSRLQLFHKLSQRNSSLLPSQYVHSSRRLVFTRFFQSLFPSLSSRFGDDQDPISLSALRIAEKYDSAFLLHMGYAYQAFIASSSADRKKGLVQYHPHIGESSKILLRDLERYPLLTNAKAQILADLRDTTNQTELSLSDLVICNSSFTAYTCVKTGIPRDRIKVIPFGIDYVPSLQTHSFNKRTKCNFLYVGSGLHRKGLHHLLEAWSSANLSHSKLTIVCRHCDPQIQSSYSLASSVDILPSVTSKHLDHLFTTSDVFVMPSLVEGFGYVYLEALSRGCFCLGTANTGLPDIADQTCSEIIPAGDPLSLTQSLQNLEYKVLSHGINREYIISYAQQWSWSRFRSDIVKSVQSELL